MVPWRAGTATGVVLLGWPFHKHVLLGFAQFHNENREKHADSSTITAILAGDTYMLPAWVAW